MTGGADTSVRPASLPTVRTLSRVIHANDIEFANRGEAPPATHRKTHLSGLPKRRFKILRCARFSGNRKLLPSLMNINATDNHAGYVVMLRRGTNKVIEVL